MMRIAAALLLFSTPAFGQVDEQTKINALKVGYALNGNSMVRWGSIDLTSVGKTMIPPVIVGADDKPKREPRRFRRYRDRR